MKLHTLLITAAVAVASLGACGDDSNEPAAEATPSTAQMKETATAESSPSHDEAPLVLSDGWVRATDAAMTGMFGTLANNTDADITIVGGETTLANDIEMHQVVEHDGEQVMQEVEHGHTIAAHTQLHLEPGADHIMLLGLVEDIPAGETITLTVRDADGNQYELSAQSRESAIEEGPYHSHGDADADVSNDSNQEPAPKDSPSEHAGH